LPRTGQSYSKLEDGVVAPVCNGLGDVRLDLLFVGGARPSRCWLRDRFRVGRSILEGVRDPEFEYSSTKSADIGDDAVEVCSLAVARQVSCVLREEELSLNSEFEMEGRQVSQTQTCGLVSWHRRKQILNELTLVRVRGRSRRGVVHGRVRQRSGRRWDGRSCLKILGSRGGEGVWRPRTPLEGF